MMQINIILSNLNFAKVVLFGDIRSNLSEKSLKFIEKRAKMLRFYSFLRIAEVALPQHSLYFLEKVTRFVKIFHRKNGSWKKAILEREEAALTWFAFRYIALVSAKCGISGCHLYDFTT